ncbi:DUF4340 domain-containing protein [Anabaena aphanizomenioides LEGE 00250]|uniref:DUF4340 domain-containing protein n=2 Tax=Sphaerospermopsis aphanizomenoides TaxID=459663 RepID=A0ABR9V9A2_9CYAN|nr:DUF4340 domain-containing protein [Sphaerospermopsis aphanizomenoides LEGE 00250]
MKKIPKKNFANLLFLLGPFLLTLGLTVGLISDTWGILPFAQNHLNKINQVNQQNQQTQTTKQQIFSFNVEDVQSIDIKTKDYTLNLERSQKLEAPKWSIKLPKSPNPEPAKEAIVSYLTDLLVKGKSESSVSISPNQLSEFGLDKPQATIDIKLKNQKTHQVILGKPNFNNTFLYAQADPVIDNNGNTQVLLVSKDFANAVNRELSEWQEISQASANKPNEQNTEKSGKQTSEEGAKQAEQDTKLDLVPIPIDPNPAHTK